MKAHILFLSLICTCLGNNVQKMCTDTPEKGSFYYFAYGSNLLPERMHINCITAVSCHEPARLEDYRLDFTMSMSRWDGAVATVIEDHGSLVWGNLWQISDVESTKLNEQEGVSKSLYHPKQVNVTLVSGLTVPARVYVNSHPPGEKVAPEQQPPERRPSSTYHQVILLGALRCHLPVSYLIYLLRFPDNGRVAPSLIRKDLGYPFYDSSFP